jgi:hypothetical protein
MGRLYIPAEKTIDGPWLLDQQALEKLDEVLSIVSSKLEEACASKVKKNVADNVKDKKIEIKLTSTDLKQNLDTTIKGILKDSKTKELKPKELYIHIENGGPQNEFKLIITAGIEGTVDYQIRCYDESIEEDIKYEFDKWLDANRPNRLAQWWSKLYFMVLAFGGLFILGLWANLYDTISYPGSFNEAHRLIDSGINQNNIHKATELILKIQSQYVPKDFPSEEVLNLNVLKILKISILVFVIWILCPRTTIGIGKHVGLLKFYKIWLYVAFILIPSSILLPTIRDWLNKLL